MCVWALGVSLFVCLGSGALGWSLESGVPEMVMEERSFNFGRVREGTAVEHTFRVRNKGEGDLRIVRVKPG